MNSSKNHASHLSPKEISDTSLYSLSSEPNPEFFDQIVKKNENYNEEKPKSETTFISVNIKQSYDSKMLSSVNDYDPESDSISECDLDLDKESTIHQNEAKIGIEPFSKNSFFLFKICFLNFFLYLLRLSFKVIKKGQTISMRHLQFLTKEQKIVNDVKIFLEKFDAELKKNNGVISEWCFSLILFRLFKKRLFLAYFFWIINICTCFIFSLFIDKLLSTHENNKEDIESYYWAFALSIGFFIQYLSGSWGWYVICEFGTKFRLLLINSLYLKVMKLNNFSIQKANIGKIINIIANDMNTVEFKFVFLIFLLTTPVTFALSIYLLWRKLGPICLLTIPILVMIYFLQKTLSSANVKNIKEKNMFSDQRMKLCNEFIEGIRLLKIYAWETTLKKFLDEIREKEINALRKYSYYIYGDRSISSNSSYIVCLILFFVFNAMDENHFLTPSLIFSIYQLMEYVRIYQVSYVGFGVSFLFEFKVVLRRIIDILTIKEAHQNEQELAEFDEKNDKNLALLTENYTAYWDLEPNAKPVLKNLSIRIEKGKTYAIFGKIGSGKSSFFYSVLKEIPKSTGNLKKTVSIAYVEQEPFIVHGTIRSNILFFKEFNERLYRKVLRVCCLEKDLIVFPQKDLTEIGERGLNLSGGQKARISLARALYSEADLYLLDDPLSALDAKVGRKVFELGILKFLRKKTVILITHQIQFLKDVDHIFLFDKGEMVKQGSFMSFKKDLSNYFESNEIQEVETEKKEEKIEILFHQNSLKNSVLKPVKKLYDNQEDAEAQVSLLTYVQFFKYSNSLIIAISCVILFILFEGSKYCTSFLYSFFGPQTSQISNEHVFISLFFVLFAQIFISFFKYFFFVKVVLNSNRNIHMKMAESVVRAPSLFFDTHHSGSILNRFSNDIGLMDSLLIYTLIDFFDLSMTFISGIIISGSINVWFFIPGAISMICLYKVFIIGKPVILGLKKLDLQNKSPIFGFFSSTLSGLSTINVYGRNQNFIDQYSNLIENSARCNNNFWEISRGFGFAVENISKITSVIGLFITLYINDCHTGIFGQQIIYLLLISETLQWGMRQAINADSVMSSTLRVLRFIDIPSEDLLYKPKDRELISMNQWIQTMRGNKEEINILYNPLMNIPLNELKGQWPAQGRIDFNKVSLRYRDELEPTLHKLNFEILPGEKIGVVGRTGAGKSSLIQALFRMFEIHEGKIEIDRINVKEIGLHTLRGNISIIPQNPYVFTGSIRRNIDPMRLSSDEEIWKALENVELKTHVEGLAKGIDSDMSYAKSVFSVGQKQLLCLARSILKRNKIIVLDEATANVDSNTDMLIQKTIKELFKSCTVLTVAHRLLTIADYDKVLVMERGCLVEFDEPFMLLTDEEKPFEIVKKGYFAEMVKSMGVDTSKKLLEITRNSYFMKRTSGKKS